MYTFILCALFGKESKVKVSIMGFNSRSCVYKVEGKKGQRSFPLLIFLSCSGDFSSVMEEMVEALCRHVSDDSPTVRRLCLRGLVQVRVILSRFYLLVLIL